VFKTDFRFSTDPLRATPYAYPQTVISYNLLQVRLQRSLNHRRSAYTSRKHSCQDHGRFQLAVRLCKLPGLLTMLIVYPTNPFVAFADKHSRIHLTPECLSRHQFQVPIPQFQLFLCRLIANIKVHWYRGKRFDQRSLADSLSNLKSAGKLPRSR